MSRGANAPRLLSRLPPGLAVAAYLSCFAPTPASAAAATAKRDDHRPASSSTPVPQSPSSAPAAEHGAAAQGCCAAPSPPPVAAKRPHERLAASGSAPAASKSPAAQPRSEQGGTSAGQRPQPSAGGKRHHGGGDAAGERSNHRTAGAGRGNKGEGEAAGGHEAQGAAANEPQALSTRAVSRRKREKQRERDRRGKGKEEKRGRGAPEPVAGKPRPNAAPVVVASSAALRASAAPTPAALASTVATPPAVVARSQSVGGAPPRRAAQRHHRAASHARASLAPATAATRPGIAAGAPAAPAGTSRVEPARVATRKVPVQRTPSPLVTTVTRIINVVPPLVRILIGALVALALALGASSRLIALRARRLARQRRQLLEDVGLLQGALLPELPGRLGPVGTSAAYRPASGPAAGGDFYDVFALADGQLAVIVGDVSGHGRQALPHTTLVRFTLRAYLEAGLSPRGALQSAAPVLERQLGGSFATVVLATYHPRDRVLVYACAGHPPPIVIGTQAIAPITACSSPPIGAGEPTGMRQTVVSVPGRSLACFFTDGVVEARVRGELFGAERLQRTLADLEPDATASALLDRVAEESDRRPDDMAACLLCIDGNPCAPSVHVEELELDRCEAARDRVERFLLAGGVDPEEIGEVTRSVRDAVERDGGVVLELHLGEGSPKVALRQHNVTRLAPPERARARAAEASR
jgi:serine phosphatase RsbU (regulator of sigma subunit)